MNIEKARFNMIEQQIRPWNVLDKDILDMLIVVKRENYFPDEQKSLAFFDTELPLPGGTTAMCPRVEARIVQELALKKNESVLLLGAASGYLAALLAHMTRHVTVMEASAELKALAEKNLSDNGVRNVSVLHANGLTTAHTGTYDVIVVAGGLDVMPEQLQKQLNVGGRLLAIAGALPVMHANVVTRVSDASFTSRTAFDTAIAPLSGSVPVSQFKF
ncbi:protein-L-isoaspartate O-methyltransferase family protein [Undibacterium crateris]|uniref:protein-L-isoaspartate O-methyltransferase family protein n=1 Tax=Undibacterium crateris TaxID=2528175 RepID=UPI001389DE5B|nr:protein-L-isoaspartate O-methyltransferase [Undibacterium crateris]NDI86214.1 methyltransferase domain-containing protein [Undibacterium crateris]